MDKNKSQHFNYAFEALPVIFHSQTKDFFTYLERDGNQFLEFWWNHVGMRLDDDKLSEFDGVSYEVRDLPEKESTLVLVKLPPPQHDYEAYYLGLVRTPQKRWPVRVSNTRVFALERLPREISSTGINFGEITPRGRYLRLGACTTSDYTKFSDLVIKTVWKK